ncbi:MAG: hypothetical protein H7A45_08075 [Verrucomicrobiales bacterium]|nr:hypothetical protein [Verrucomicrobiales bacterium]
MTGPGHSRRLHVWLHAIAGGLVCLLAVAPGRVLDLAGCWLTLRKPLTAVALILFLLGWVTYRPRLASLSAGACVAVALAVLGIAGAEITFRALRFDFRRTEAAMRRLPPYYRRPYVPTGEVYFRHAGPEVWTGRVINTVLEQLRIDTDAYAGEAAVTLAYDPDGFRNPAGLADWGLAVAGDSFTELGFLPRDELFTSRLGALLGQGVKNLGVSHTGPLTQLHYLRRYGVAPSTRRVVIVFFEGNDPADLDTEYGALRRFETTGARPRGPLHRQSSLLRALCEAAVRDPAPVLPKEAPVPDATLRLDGARVPVTFAYLPLGRADITPAVGEAFDRFFADYRDFALARGVEAWLVYLPCKRRVWHGRLAFADDAPEWLREWTPTDLPDYLRERSVRHGLRFLDVTPDLVRETAESGRLLYNPVIDSHLNAAGAEVVARAMAAAMRELPGAGSGG